MSWFAIKLIFLIIFNMLEKYYKQTFSFFAFFYYKIWKISIKGPSNAVNLDFRSHL